MLHAAYMLPLIVAKIEVLPVDADTQNMRYVGEPTKSRLKLYKSPVAESDRKSNLRVNT